MYSVSATSGMSSHGHMAWRRSGARESKALEEDSVVTAAEAYARLPRAGNRLNRNVERVAAPASRNVTNLRGGGSGSDVQVRNRDGKLETPGSRAAGIHVQHSFPSAYARFVGMSGDDDAHTGRQPQRLHVMQDVDAHTGDIQGQLFRKAHRPITLVVVASDGIHRRERAQAGENLRAADISGMDDSLYVPQGLDRLRPQQPVRVGYQPDRDAV